MNLLHGLLVSVFFFKQAASCIENTSTEWSWLERSG